ncbi:MAG TPA: thioredoxin domain-containing protein [Terriglobales bacterium]|nr:thioredoxin domain-containing protein [Terriglobales bacterium]
MRHMVGYDPNVKWSVISIAESEVPGMALVVMRVGEGEGRLTQLYVSADGRHAIIGEMVPFGADPFADSRERLQREARGPSIGDANVPVTIVEFSDLQCPHCKAAQPTIDRLVSEVPSARLVFEHFPLEALHPWAFKAATYAQCVSDRKPRAFWTFIRAIYDNQLDITEANVDAKLKEFANASGLKGDEVAACAATPASQAPVRAAMQLGKAMGVSSTPTLFVNGRKIAGLGQLPYETLKRLVEFEVQEAQKASAVKSQPKE